MNFKYFQNHFQLSLNFQPCQTFWRRGHCGTEVISTHAPLHEIHKIVNNQHFSQTFNPPKKVFVTSRISAGFLPVEVEHCPKTAQFLRYSGSCLLLCCWYALVGPRMDIVWQNRKKFDYFAIMPKNHFISCAASFSFCAPPARPSLNTCHSKRRANGVACRAKRSTSGCIGGSGRSNRRCAA